MTHNDPLLDDPPPERGIFCNRTLNLRSVQAIGFDMDYTLIHYFSDEWERAAFEHARSILATRHWPVDDLVFDPSRFSLGLTFDLELGNLVKATRFGYVVRSQHGNQMLDFDEQRAAYLETVIDLADHRFEFMNTLFEISRASLWTQLVDLHDRHELPGVRGYVDLYRAIDEALAESHTQGALKAEIIADPDRFVDHDPALLTTLEDLRLAGKQLLLITNSDWAYTRHMMAYCFDRYLEGRTWRDLFDVVIVSAAKPRFFAETDPLFRVVDEDQSLLLPHWDAIEAGHVYFGGNARLVERSLGLSSAQLLYVGDHLFGDVHVTKDVLRWRTALIARELEDEIRAAADFADDQHRLAELMAAKVAADRQQARLRILRDRAEGNSPADLSSRLDRATSEAMTLDRQISPLAQQAATLGNEHWGPLMRAGNDKSLFARQVERYADVYTSRVSNLGHETPYAYLRAARGSLPHDATPYG